ncbi:MAG: 16S rRNA (cytidine(1402)-2'-O)-methyltransferase [Rickettsiales bacterium]|nr:16S rRNA (cytidine(1402)-2'-O)-methyltransferase [Rickettsiales bacterium]
MQTGLYIVGTPIGNMGDMSARAAAALAAADVVLCEDTRVSAKIAPRAKLAVYADYNEREKTHGIIEKIAAGAAVALITDSGMPGISDPGFRLVRAARDAGQPVFVVPGPTAFASALVLSGFPTDRFSFLGFFKNEAALREDNRLRHTLIYYESPNRVAETLAAFARVMPERRVAVVREITKLHEETIIGYPADLAGRSFKGEIVLVVEPAPEIKMTDSEIAEVVGEVVGTTKDRAAEIAKRTGISRAAAYKMALKK